MTDTFMAKTQHKLTVGLAAVRFPIPAKTDAVQQPEAIFIQGISGGTGKFFIGGSDVLADLSKPCFVFPAGYADAILPFCDDENLWVVSDVAAQTLLVTYLADRV